MIVYYGGHGGLKTSFKSSCICAARVTSILYSDPADGHHWPVEVAKTNSVAWSWTGPFCDRSSLSCHPDISCF